MLYRWESPDPWSSVIVMIRVWDWRERKSRKQRRLESLYSEKTETPLIASNVRLKNTCFWSVGIFCCASRIGLFCAVDTQFNRQMQSWKLFGENQVSEVCYARAWLHVVHVNRCNVLTNKLRAPVTKWKKDSVSPCSITVVITGESPDQKPYSHYKWNTVG